MAALEAATYKLNQASPASSTSSKRFIFVKLTDSALRAIEDFPQTKERNQASINIGEKEGCIRLPSGDIFNFTVADNPIDVPKGSFECIQKVRKGEVEHLGDIKQRITIHATEDSFSTTRQKMTLAEEESKKQCAKEIESSRTGPNLGSRVKVKRGAEQAAIFATSNKKLRADVSPVNTPFSNSARKKGSSSQPAIKPATAYPSKPPPVTSSASVSPVSNSGSSRQAPLVTNPSASRLSAPDANSSVSRSPVPSRSPVFQQQQPTRPLKERIIHTLALKTIGKVDFIQKLQKFGLKEEERSLVDGILAETAVLRDGRYDLLPNILVSQIDQKWPLYNPSDCLMVQKRLSGNNLMVENNRPLTASSSVIDRSTGKSSSTLSASASSGDLNGKGAVSGVGRGKTDERLPHEVARAFLAHPNDQAISPPPSSSSTCSTPSPPDHSKLKEIGNRNAAKKPGSTANGDDLFGSQNDQTRNARAEKDCFQDQIDLRYGAIKSSDQRRQYKKDFYSVYNEYRVLHEQMAHINGKFSNLEGKLRQTKTGSSEYKTIARFIKDDYLRLKNDEDYKKKRKRWELLTTKLTAIKQQIKQFDVAQVKA